MRDARAFLRRFLLFKAGKLRRDNQFRDTCADKPLTDYLGALSRQESRVHALPFATRSYLYVRIVRRSYRDRVSNLPGFVPVLEKPPYRGDSTFRLTSCHLDLGALGVRATAAKATRSFIYAV
jgi:hypothetical protein